MALITVNTYVLPDPNTVDPNDIYWHYQTLDNIGEPLGSPIDHGYFGAGLDPNDDLDTTVGWVLLTNDKRDLPPGLLERVQLSTQTIGVNFIPNSYYEVEPVVTSTTHITVPPIKRSFATTEVALDITESKEYSAVAESDLNSTETKSLSVTNDFNFNIVNLGWKLVDGGETDAPISIQKLLFNSDTVSLDIASRLLIETEVDIDIGSLERKLIPSQPNPLDLLIKLKQKTFTNPVDAEADITFSKLMFMAEYVLDVKSPSRKVIFDEVDVNISTNIQKIYSASSTTHIDVKKLQNIEADSGTTHVNISTQGLFTGDAETNVNIVVPEIIGASSDITNINVVAGNKTYSASSTGILNYKLVNKVYTTSDLVWIEGSTRPLYVGSNSTWIDVFAFGAASLVEECDWPVLRHLGTEDWKFLAVLEMNETIIKEKSANHVLFHEIMAAGQAKDVIYAPNGQVERMIVYTDETKATKLFEIYVEYVDGFPFRSTLLAYHFNGTNYYTATQTYKQGVDCEVLPDEFTQNLLIDPCATSPLPIDPSVDIGDWVYAGSGSTLLPAIADDSVKAKTVGLIILEPTPGFGVAQYEGLVSSVFTGLIPGEQYFLDNLLEGKMIPESSIAQTEVDGHILKKVGTAITTTDFQIDISERLVIRHGEF